MKEIQISKEDLEYNFEKWLKGIPEPEFGAWVLNNREEAIKITEAKQTTFKDALQMALDFYRHEIEIKLQKIDSSDRKIYLEGLDKKAHSYFEKFDITDIISQSHSTKYKGIDGNLYLRVKQSKEKIELGKVIRSIHSINVFFQAVLHYQVSKIYKGLINGNIEPTIDPMKKPEKGESVAVKFYLLDHFYSPKPEFLSQLIGNQEKILGYIFECRPDTAKNIKNNASKPNPDGKHITNVGKDRFNELLKKLKKGDKL